jgi:uncharacterized membrane protein (DUF441 family)
MIWGLVLVTVGIPELVFPPPVARGMMRVETLRRIHIYYGWVASLASIHTSFKH